MGCLKNNLTLIVTFLFYFTLFGQSESQIKNALATIAQVHIGMQTTSCYYMTPDDYIKNSNGKIIGQNYLYPKERKFLKITLLEDEGRFNQAKVGVNTLDLVWSDIKLSKVEDFELGYDTSGKLITMRGTTGKTINYVYEGSQLKEIYASKIYKGKEWVNSVRKVSITKNGFNMTMDLYKKGKPMKQKFIRSQSTCYCKKESDDKYEVLFGWEIKGFYSFKNNGLTTKAQLHERSGNIRDESYHFNSDGKLQRKEVRITEQDLFTGTHILVLEVPSDNSELKEWQIKKGFHKLDQEGEWIYQKEGNKSREKINGTWTKFKSGNACMVK